MWNDLWDIFIGFLRASNLGFGGGPAVIPLIQAECERYAWLDSAQFSDAIAAANALPGPVATKMASYIGFKIASWPGAFVAVTATILPTILLLIFLGALLKKYAHSPKLQAALKGVRPVITALLLYVAIDMGQSAFAVAAPRDLLTIPIALAAAALLYLRRIHPALLVVLGMGAGFILF
ncbi:MAG: chromate transporter [Gracilibacteraceae bacterium]|jgi:chromate transporter|nr:chromate transporter [Gracilibacteraceae bacterium]